MESRKDMYRRRYPKVAQWLIVLKTLPDLLAKAHNCELGQTTRTLGMHSNVSTRGFATQHG